MRHGRKPHEWTPEQDALLGTMSDAAAAAKISVCTYLVARRRAQLNIPCFYKKKTLPEDVTKLLGTMQDVQLAKITGYKAWTIRNARRAADIPPFDAGNQEHITQLAIDALNQDPLAQLLNGLSKRQLAVIALRAIGLTLEEIGQELGVTKQRIKQLETQAGSIVALNTTLALIKLRSQNTLQEKSPTT